MGLVNFFELQCCLKKIYQTHNFFTKSKYWVEEQDCFKTFYFGAFDSILCDKDVD